MESIRDLSSGSHTFTNAESNTLFTDPSHREATSSNTVESAAQTGDSSPWDYGSPPEWLTQFISDKSPPITIPQPASEEPDQKSDSHTVAASTPSASRTTFTGAHLPGTSEPSSHRRSSSGTASGLYDAGESDESDDWYVSSTGSSSPAEGQCDNEDALGNEEASSRTISGDGVGGEGEREESIGKRKESSTKSGKRKRVSPEEQEFFSAEALEMLSERPAKLARIEEAEEQDKSTTDSSESEQSVIRPRLAGLKNKYPGLTPVEYRKDGQFQPRKVKTSSRTTHPVALADPQPHTQYASAQQVPNAGYKHQSSHRGVLIRRSTLFTQHLHEPRPQRSHQLSSLVQGTSSSTNRDQSNHDGISFPQSPHLAHGIPNSIAQFKLQTPPAAWSPDPDLLFMQEAPDWNGMSKPQSLVSTNEVSSLPSQNTSQFPRARRKPKSPSPPRQGIPDPSHSEQQAVRACAALAEQIVIAILEQTVLEESTGSRNITRDNEIQTMVLQYRVMRMPSDEQIRARGRAIALYSWTPEQRSIVGVWIGRRTAWLQRPRRERG